MYGLGTGGGSLPMPRFEVEEFVARCREAAAGPQALPAVKEILAEALARPADIARALGTPSKAGIVTLHRSDGLTVLNIIWGANMSLFPHDHQIWAAIGIYGGQEDNLFYRRTAQGLQQTGGQRVETGSVLTLGPDAVHSVINPRNVLTGAIHVYGGDFFEQRRTEWDSATFEERPFAMEHLSRVFEEANRAAALGASGDR